MMFLKFLCYRAQMLMKARLKGAQKGHSLLKKKADALQLRFRIILGKIIEVSMKNYYYTKKKNWSGGSFSIRFLNK